MDLLVLFLTFFNHTENVENVCKSFTNLSGMRSAGNKKITRQRKEIFPGYEKIVQDRTKMTEDKLWQEDDENDDDNIIVRSSLTHQFQTVRFQGKALVSSQRFISDTM